jgi:hypothetical protein
MNFRDVLTAKSLRFIVITVFLGAIGSGAWEWLLKPFLMGATDFGLNVATLGVRSFKDSLYKDIARGLHEESSLRLYAAVFGLLPCFILGIVTGALQARKKAKAGIATTAFDRAMDKLGMPLLVLLIFALVFSMVQANQLAYVNRSITHVHQLLAIVDPYIREDERLLFRSQFAQIASSEDYSKLTSALEAICNAKALKVPEFAVW